MFVRTWIDALAIAGSDADLGESFGHVARATGFERSREAHANRLIPQDKSCGREGICFGAVHCATGKIANSGAIKFLRVHIVEFSIHSEVAASGALSFQEVVGATPHMRFLYGDAWKSKLGAFRGE